MRGPVHIHAYAIRQCRVMRVHVHAIRVFLLLLVITVHLLKERTRHSLIHEWNRVVAVLS